VQETDPELWAGLSLERAWVTCWRAG